MKIRVVRKSEQEAFDQVAVHPLQSWAWGEFRERQGQKVVRLGAWKKEKLVAGIQMMIHQLPHLPWTVGYVPRGVMPNRAVVDEIRKEARKHRCIFVKLEPNIKVKSQMGKLGLRPGKALFTPYTFQVDLTKSEAELLASMKPKTRYNIKLAERRGVVVEEDSSNEALAQFQRLTEETLKRQGFFAHDREYRELMWRTMSKAKTAKMLVARHGDDVLTVWIIFLFGGVGYYPYGASSLHKRNLMASNLVAWRALQLAKAAGCRTFDFWGSLGPTPSKSDPWYGFHRFKEGYGGELVELVGTWDLVINPLLYVWYSLADKARWWWLRRA